LIVQVTRVPAIVAVGVASITLPGSVTEKTRSGMLGTCSVIGFGLASVTSSTSSPSLRVRVMVASLNPSAVSSFVTSSNFALRVTVFSPSVRLSIVKWGEAKRAFSAATVVFFSRL
jgi:hypothetical protein